MLILMTVIKLNSYLFTCKLNSPEVIHDVSTRKNKEAETKHLQTKVQNKTVHVVIIIITV
jgi:hypothetical protein